MSTGNQNGAESDTLIGLLNDKTLKTALLWLKLRTEIEARKAKSNGNQSNEIQAGLNLLQSITDNDASLSLNEKLARLQVIVAYRHTNSNTLPDYLIEKLQTSV